MRFWRVFVKNRKQRCVFAAFIKKLQKHSLLSRSGLRDKRAQSRNGLAGFGTGRADWKCDGMDEVVMSQLIPCTHALHDCET